MSTRATAYQRTAAARALLHKIADEVTVKSSDQAVLRHKWFLVKAYPAYVDKTPTASRSFVVDYFLQEERVFGELQR